MSTPLSRYWKDTPPFSATHSQPTANTIYSALCEVTSDQICSPSGTGLYISPSASAMHLSSAGGWKNRQPVSTFWNLNNETGDLSDSYNINSGLRDIIYHSVIEDDRKLIWVADEDRIKSFAWPISATSGKQDRNNRPRALPIHTLNSPCNGPLHATKDRLFRTGKGYAATWKIDELETHGPDGTLPIGQIDDDDEDEYEDDGEYIEHSTGSKVAEKITFHNKSLEPSHWRTHPSKAGYMICISESVRSNVRLFSCNALDLESGKLADTYLGHSGEVHSISTSAADPNVFLTSCNDGYVRLFDTRHCLPMLTLNVGKGSDACDTAVLCYPDGVPCEHSPLFVSNPT